ncbi:MAG TPA: hypothetical protein VF677_00405 [Flavobacterium sp.]|jgi:hydrogenase maturation factor HypE
MNDQQIIDKATRVLKELKLYNSNYIDISVLKEINDTLIEIEPEIKNRYSVMFSYELPDGRRGHTSVYVDRKSNKLISVITKSNSYKIPEELS